MPPSFSVPPSVELTDDERDILARYGHWLDSLARGEVEPKTPEQHQFVRVAMGEAEPKSAFERAWAKARRPADPPPSGPLELDSLFEKLLAARGQLAELKRRHELEREAILESVRPQLDALDAELTPLIESATAAAELIEADARSAVLASGASFKRGAVHAVYTPERVTWDGKGLARYWETHPELGEFRRVGGPTVALRFEK